MAALATAAAVGLSLVMAGERGMFFVPGADDFRKQTVARTDRERDWPFSVDSGYLLCAWVMGERAVYFLEALPDDEADDDVEPRAVAVSADPLAIVIGSIGNRDLLAPFETIEQLVLRMAPFERIGRRLCDQPPGTDLGPGEL